MRATAFLKMTNVTITTPLRRINPYSPQTTDSHTISAQTNVPIPAVAVVLGTDADISATPEKWSYNYRVWRTRVGTALLEYGMEKEAFQFNGCFEHPVNMIKSSTPTLNEKAVTVWLCSHDPNHEAALFMPTCDLRICPDCAARATARLAARYIPKAIELTASGGRYHLRHIVFTTPIELTSDTPENIRKAVIRYSNLPRRAMQQVQDSGELLGKHQKTEGAIQSFEFGEDGLKLHFHVIQYGDYLPQDELSKAWQKVTKNEASIIYVKSIDASTPEKIQNRVIETLKYSVKFWKIDTHTNEYTYLEPNVMPHLLRVIKGVRRVKSWGCFYNLPKPKAEKFKCEECHNQMIRLGLDGWQNWIESREAGIQLVLKMRHDALLHLKLANKSKKAHLYESHSPPDEEEKYRQKDLWKPVSHSHYHYEDNL
jgi:hypothetical protein